MRLRSGGMYRREKKGSYLKDPGQRSTRDGPLGYASLAADAQILEHHTMGAEK